jgi:hypothetical protein
MLSQLLAQSPDQLVEISGKKLLISVTVKDEWEVGWLLVGCERSR